MTMRGLTAVAMATMALAIGAGSAAAQSPDETRLSVAAGGGIANPLHGDFQFNAQTWHATVRLRSSRLVSFEATYSEWRHTETSTYTNIVTGSANRIGRVVTETEYVARTAGFNVLLQHAVGRFGVWGGAGPGFMTLGHRYRYTASECQGIARCDTYTNDYSDGAFAVQGVAGFDVGLTSRIAAFGQYGFMIPTEDPGAGHVTLTAGVRVRLW